MGNALARERRQQTQSTSPAAQPKIVYKKPRLVPAEICYYILLLSMIVGISVVVLMNSSSIYQASMTVNASETKIETLQDEIEGLKEEKAILSQPERIKSIAEKHGLSLQQNKVKNVQSQE
ncbi:cell division protein FtsL [Aureibacillus halotolerans]|uniref:Cell division protein FtsL n=1 Tax=Aureibacillus halotolerans TaxID=1508390 RepID=A0A4R6UBH2_9BACI|nr:cell division protein FtsL [Aureibacillus halotolerans]TDQ42319.1 cell division protein FtsL [Aureibacillus halotolerans]